MFSTQQTKCQSKNMHTNSSMRRTKPNQNEPNRSEPNQIELSRVELCEDCESRTQIWRLCHILLCMTNIVCMYLCACVCACYRILSIWVSLVSGLRWTLILILIRTLKSGFCLFVRSSECPFVRLSICPLVASQSIVQMSKLHLLCASQKLKQIILPIAFWFRMSVTVLLLGGYAMEVEIQDSDSVWGWAIGFIVRPQFMLIFVYLPPAASEIMQCLY